MGNIKMTTVKYIVTILIGLTFVACNNTSTDTKNVSTSSDTIKTVSLESLNIDQKKFPQTKKKLK